MKVIRHTFQWIFVVVGVVVNVNRMRCCMCPSMLNKFRKLVLEFRFNASSVRHCLTIDGCFLCLSYCPVEENVNDMICFFSQLLPSIHGCFMNQHNQMRYGYQSWKYCVPRNVSSIVLNLLSTTIRSWA